MSDTPVAVIQQDDVEWVFEDEVVFEHEAALAVLLAHSVIIINSHWWRTDLSEADRARISVSVVCNDVFAWACADAQPLPYSQLHSLYRCWRQDNNWGPAVWAICARRQSPQEPVDKLLRSAGWDMDLVRQGFDIDVVLAARAKAEGIRVREVSP